MGSGRGQTGGKPSEARKGRPVFYQCMASATRTKPPQKGSKQKGGRRLPPKVKTGPDVPLLPVVVGGILVLVAIGIIIFTLANNKSNLPASAGDVPCDELEHTQTHYHAALQIVYQGEVRPIPANIGISGSPSAPTCYYWLHVHQANPDVIHIESPRDRTFTVGDFFKVWDTWAQANGKPRAPLDATHVSTFTLTADQKLVIYIDDNDGKGPQVFTGDPKTIQLKSHRVITLEITPPEVTPPPAFSWTSTANNGL
jgi:hypothetical protein